MLVSIPISPQVCTTATFKSLKNMKLEIHSTSRHSQKNFVEISQLVSVAPDTWIVRQQEYLRLTLHRLFMRRTILRNISSSLDVSCVIRRTMRPVLRSGTRNVSLSCWFSSTIPLQGNKWITLLTQKILFHKRDLPLVQDRNTTLQLHSPFFVIGQLLKELLNCLLLEACL
jgi:hypothetical protein